MTKGKNLAKKALLKKLISAKSPNPKGAEPFKMDNGLGKNPVVTTPDAIMGGGGSNLGTNGVF